MFDRIDEGLWWDRAWMMLFAFFGYFSKAVRFIVYFFMTGFAHRNAVGNVKAKFGKISPGLFVVWVEIAAPAVATMLTSIIIPLVNRLSPLAIRRGASQGSIFGSNATFPLRAAFSTKPLLFYGNFTQILSMLFGQRNPLAPLVFTVALLQSFNGPFWMDWFFGLFNPYTGMAFCVKPIMPGAVTRKLLNRHPLLAFTAPFQSAFDALYVLFVIQSKVFSSPFHGADLCSHRCRPPSIKNVSLSHPIIAHKTYVYEGVM